MVNLSGMNSDPPNFVSHNANLNVKKGYIMEPRELIKMWLMKFGGSEQNIPL